MSLLAAILIGILIGGIGGFVLQENFDLLLFNVLMGIVGAVLGGALCFFTVTDVQYFSFTWISVLFSVVGALIFVLIFSALHRLAPKEPIDPTDLL